MTQNKKILITGADGFIGSKLYNLLDKNPKFKVVKAQIELESQGSIKSCIQAEDWDCVIHLAGISYAPECEKNPETAFNINSEAVKTLAQTLAKHNPKAHLIFPSTAYVYAKAEGNSVLIDESFPLKPANVYAKTKLKAEEYLEQVTSELSLQTTVLRLFNHTHYSQSTNFFLPNMYQQLLKLKASEHPELEVGNLEIERDFGSISDLLEVFKLVVQKNDLLNTFDTFNVCSGFGKNLKDIVQELANSLEIRDIKFNIDPSRVRNDEPNSIVGKSDKIQRTLNWTPNCKTTKDLVDSFLKEL